MSNVELKSNENYSITQLKLISLLKSFQGAIIDKDIDLLDKLLDNNYVLTHMSGKNQSKNDFMDELADNTLNYYHSTINNPIIAMDNDDNVIIECVIVLDAKVYGISGTWSLNSKLNLVKTDNKWRFTKWNTTR